MSGDVASAQPGSFVKLKTGNWWFTRYNPPSPRMMVTSPVSPTNDAGFDVSSIRVFWLDEQNAPHEASLPVAGLDVCP